MGQLLLKSEAQIHSLSPPDIVVDSPYDLKSWAFKIKSPALAFPDPSWLQLGHEAISVAALSASETPASLSGPEQSRELRRRLSDKPEWSLTLPLRIAFSPVRFFGTAFVLGVLLAAPAITTAWRVQGGTIAEKVVTSLIASVFGVAAAALAAFQIKRPV